MRCANANASRGKNQTSSMFGCPGGDGLLNGSLGMTTSDGSDGFPSPASFSAVTRKMYSVSSTRSLTSRRGCRTAVRFTFDQRVE